MKGQILEILGRAGPPGWAGLQARLPGRADRAGLTANTCSKHTWAHGIIRALHFTKPGILQTFPRPANYPPSALTTPLISTPHQIKARRCLHQTTASSGGGSLLFEPYLPIFFVDFLWNCNRTEGEPFLSEGRCSLKPLQITPPQIIPWI